MGKWVIHQRDNGSVIVIFYHLNNVLPPQICFDSPDWSVEKVLENLCENGPLSPFEWVVIERWGKQQISWCSGKRAQA